MPRTLLLIPSLLAAVAIFAQQPAQTPPPAPDMSVPAGAAAVEQTAQGNREPAAIVTSFDGLGESFEGPQGKTALRNPSDNSIAVGPDHIVVTVNSRMAIFTKKGRRFADSGKPLYGPVNTNNVFKGFGGRCEAQNNGDARGRRSGATGITCRRARATKSSRSTRASSIASAC